MTPSGSPDAYTTDVVYPSAFGAFQSPIHLVHAAWLGGAGGPSLTAPFTYVDLGCGAGLTACVLADCYPAARIHGVDLNPDHIRLGRELAARAGLSNVTFHHVGFADLDRLPAFDVDFVGLSGVYSWLSPPLRAACLDFAARRLTPQGLVFLHYGALPGNAQIDALYALIREAARGLDGDSVARFRTAAAAVRAVKAAGGRFFRANPQAAAWLDQLDREDPASMAHEVLNAQRASLSARDAADEAERAGLRFVANAQIELNDLDLTAPDALRADLSAREPVTREMLMDAVRDPHSRMDVLQRTDGRAAMEPPGIWVDRLTRGDLSEARRKLGERARVDLMSPVYTGVLRRLEGRAAPLAEFCDTRENTLAVQRLAALKLVHFLREPYRPGSGSAPRMASALNAEVLAGRIESPGPVPFASPVAGTQVLLPPQDRLALLALLEGDFDAAWRRVQAAGQVIRSGGGAIGDATGLRRAAESRAQAMGHAMISQLSRLGVLA
jgi:ubiquinone/menaquinone biosynthesis C-methylase UbiE